MRFGGRESPRVASAPRTRSRLSPTALSGRPTTANAGKPALIFTCTSTGWDSTPWKATVAMWETMKTPKPLRILTALRLPAPRSAPAERRGRDGAAFLKQVPQDGKQGRIRRRHGEVAQPRGLHPAERLALAGGGDPLQTRQT